MASTLFDKAFSFDQAFNDCLNMKKNILNAFTLSATIALLIILWFYAALTKVVDYNNFVATLSRSPLIDQFANTIGWTLLTVEFGIVLLLFFPKLQALGLYASALLLIVFTGYILYMLSYVPHLPCSCGGIIQQLSWKQHLIFNVAFILITIFGIRSFRAIHQ